MSNLNYNGQPISQKANGYISGTEMAKANNFNINDWSSNFATIAYIEAVSLDTGIPAARLKIKVSEGFPAQNSTFLHPLVALHLAQWISPEFHLWTIKHIKTLMETGSTTLVEQPKPVETKLMVAHELRMLNESTLPAAVKQLLIDSLMNEYITDSRPVLEASKERWVGCAQKAEEMGYITNQSTRGKLGKFVKGNSDDLISKQEDRLCNGMMRSIWVYLDSPELEVVIHDYFNPEVY